MIPVAIVAVVAVVASVLAVTVRVARRSRPVKIDDAETAASAVEAAVPGFAVSGAVVGADGAGAIAVSRDNRVAAVAPVGRRIVAREIGWSAVRATAEGMLVETGDRQMRQVALAGIDVLDIRRLAPMPAGAAADVSPAD